MLAESELTEHTLPDNELLQTKSSLNLAGVDLDNFFTESNWDLVSHSMEDPRATNSQSENAEMNSFSSRENVSLFQNVHHSSTAFSSSETKANDGFSGWEADFSVHMDSVFGSGKDLEDEKAKHASALLELTSDDQIRDDLWNNVNILVPHQVDITINSKGLVAADNLYSHPSTGTDRFPDDMWQTSGATAPENKTIREDDDSFEIWNDFTSSKNAQDSSKDSLIQSRDQRLLLLANVKVEVGENVVQAANNGDIFNSATQSEHDVESLLSQMHDLSFMLKSNLSVPSK
ncbi:hypothetical protein RHSIM_Rhsim06G0164700 [Rhododendron simsii]|uniref:Uncharacterized protein n=1 Tax=Rhododendron simsii TaxID=118357 RepID=A0A834FWS2_RHOSS|nr:hypothetical protein RHSIM_RhsimUnG0010700 [Rhododendron simsii]KAF7141364.1 hypothetical protein RHSIM_Rhsim06G0164700 [Rhododendron simsii]